MSATLAGSMASHLVFGQWSDDDMDSHEILRPMTLKLTQASSTSYAPGFLEPQMAQELLKGMSSDKLSSATCVLHKTRTDQKLNRWQRPTFSESQRVKCLLPCLTQFLPEIRWSS